MIPIGRRLASSDLPLHVSCDPVVRHRLSRRLDPGFQKGIGVETAAEGTGMWTGETTWWRHNKAFKHGTPSHAAAERMKVIHEVSQGEPRGTRPSGWREWCMLTSLYRPICFTRTRIPRTLMWPLSFRVDALREGKAAAHTMVFQLYSLKNL
ncbi:hypothetical protein ACQJBY_038741 [Aegilops geniculata]